jgi:hypothetical protein
MAFFESLVTDTLKDLIRGTLQNIEDSLFENESEKCALDKTDFEIIIQNKIIAEEFPLISNEDIKSISIVLSKSDEIISLVEQLYNKCTNKTLCEI